MRFPLMRGVIAVALFSGVLAAGTAAEAGTTSAAVHGADISWPNCPKGEGIPLRRSSGEPMPESTAKFVVVGVTNGPGFFPNPCLANEVAWVAQHHRLLAAYAMTTYPKAAQLLRYSQAGPFDGSTAKGALQNAGYAEATYNLSTMAATSMDVPMIWVDVEPYPKFPWPKNRANNRAIITGAMRAYTDSGHRVGIYTYANGWPLVVGNWRLPTLPTWSTIGHGSAVKARKTCGHGPSGGPDWVMQWFTEHRDRDVLCPAAPGLGSLFTRPVFATQ